MSIRIFVIGDLHFKKNDTGVSDLVIQKLTEKINGEKPDMIVFLGDTLDTHEKIDMGCLNKAVKFFKTLAQVFPVVVIIGNHDRPDGTTNLTDSSAFYCLRGWKNIFVIDGVMDIAWPLSDGKKLRFVFVPYVAPKFFQQAIDQLKIPVNDKKEPADCVFAHQSFVGAKDGGMSIRSGDKWDISNPLLISGHIHVYQKPQANLIYAGTPYQQSFRDESEKGILLCQFEYGKPPKVNFVRLETLRKKAIDLKPSEVDSFIPPENCEVKVNIQGSLEEITDLTKKGMIAKMRSKGVAVNLTPIKSSNQRNPEGKSFRKLVEESIEDDEDAKRIYQQIFSVNTTAPVAKISPSSKLDSLVDIIRTIKPTQVTGEIFIPSGPTSIEDLKEKAPYTVDEKGRPRQLPMNNSELQNSLKQSVLAEQAKPKPLDVTALINQALEQASGF